MDRVIKIISYLYCDFVAILIHLANLGFDIFVPRSPHPRSIQSDIRALVGSVILRMCMVYPRSAVPDLSFCCGSRSPAPPPPFPLPSVCPLASSLVAAVFSPSTIPASSFSPFLLFQLASALASPAAVPDAVALFSVPVVPVPTWVPVLISAVLLFL